MPRESIQTAVEPSRAVGAKRTHEPRPYIAKAHYGTRNAERDKRIISIGEYRATMYRRSDLERSSWFLRYFLKDEGKHYRKSLRTTDEAEARKRASKELVSILGKVENGQRIITISVADLAERFHEHQKKQVASGELAARTVEVQRYRVNLGCEFIAAKLPSGNATKLSNIDGKIFHQYLEWRVAKAEIGTSKGRTGTIRRDVVRDELLVIRKMFSFAKKEQLCSERSIPQWDFQVEKVGSKRERIKPRDYIDVVNCVRSWVGQARSERDTYHRRLLQHFLLVVANTGLRSGELFGLKNCDVQKREATNECLINIRAETSKVRRARQITVNPSSGGRALGSKEINYLLRWMTAHQRHRNPNDYVFAPFDTPNIQARDGYYHAYKNLRTALKEVKLDWFDTYHARHFYITNRLLAEESIHLVAKACGTSVKEIESTYSHVITELATKHFGRKVVEYAPDNSWTIVPVDSAVDLKSRTKNRRSKN